MIASMLVEIRSTEGLVSIVGIIAGASDPKIIWYNTRRLKI